MLCLPILPLPDQRPALVALGDSTSSGQSINSWHSSLASKVCHGLGTDFLHAILLYSYMNVNFPRSVVPNWECHMTISFKLPLP